MRNARRGDDGMRIGFHLTPFWGPASRSATALIDEAVRVVGVASRLGFAWVSAPHHWLGHPSFFPHPLPVLARLAPEAGAMRLKTNVLILPLLNAVDAAESLATLDHICHGRLDVGVGIGYRETELVAAGVTRRDRAPKLEESLEVMKRLWRGEELTFDGRYTRLRGGRMGYRPCQTPHPFLEMAAQKRNGTCSRLVVTGCLAERYSEELRREIPEIDAVLGTGEVRGILEAIEGHAHRGAESRGVVAPLTFHSKRPRPTYIYDADTPRLLTTPRHFAYVKVAESCDYTCAFCIIPTLRGSYRSRAAESIVREARSLAERGVRELLLISQDTTFYGIDRGELQHRLEPVLRFLREHGISLAD